jgi:homoserine dehydrogenase
MNAVIQARATTRACAAMAPPARIALLGTGTVGRAVLARLASWRDASIGCNLQLVYAANSRLAVRPCAGARAPSTSGASDWLACFPAGAAEARASGPGDVERVLAGAGVRIVIDATASEAVAERHAYWLARGLHVVTASKLGQGGALARWRAIRAACAAAGTRYGDSATVGAGLPLLRTLRELQAGGDRIHAVAGVLSGSLAWLFHHYDGMRPFSALVRQARDDGYTEPDPRDDLSGEDVRRKLLILARAAGASLDAGDVEVDPLVPPALAAVARDGLDDALSSLDPVLRARYAAASKRGERLRFVGRVDFDSGGPRAHAGLASLPANDPLASGAGTDNRVAIWSDRYCAQPLLIQGPGAGAGATAAALLDDALRIAREAAGLPAVA